MNLSIKLPNDLRGKLLSFPFIHALVKEAKKKLNAQEEEVLNLHLISNKKDIDVLNLLPFNAYYHELEEDDLKSIFSIHRACVELKIDQTDFYFSTTESFVDASIGKNLKAKNQVGFQISKNNLFLNQKILVSKGDHQSVQIFNLIRGFQQEDLPSIPVVCSREVKPYFADWNMNEYFVINLSLTDKEIHPEWLELINLFEHKNIVLLSDGFKPENYQDKMNDFVKKLSTKNNYKIYTHESHIDFAKVITYSWAFISEDSSLVQLASYCGATVFHINRKEDADHFGNQYFLGETVLFSLKNAEFKLENDFNFSKIFDEIYRYIEIKSQEKSE